MISSKQRFTYWCHKCQRETFPISNENGEASCNFCRNTCIEDIESYREDHPQSSNQIAQTSRRANSVSPTISRPPRTIMFQIYGNGPSNLAQFQMESQDNYRINLFDQIGNNINFAGGNPILAMLFSNINPLSTFLQQHRDDEQFENLLNLIMQQDPNRYGTPPATKESIQKLKEEIIRKENIDKFLENVCSVCKELYKIGEIIKIMPCEHVFHKHCLTPWLEIHNSCPVCRYELPTSDLDYETRKEQIRHSLSNTSHGTNQSTRERRGRVSRTPNGRSLEDGKNNQKNNRS